MNKGKDNPQQGTSDWIDRHADALDYPDAGDPFRADILIDAPRETTARLKALMMGILPGCRFYEVSGHLYRVHQDSTFAVYTLNGWLPIEGATLRTDAATEVTADVARSVVEPSGKPSTR